MCNAGVCVPDHVTVTPGCHWGGRSGETGKVDAYNNHSCLMHHSFVSAVVTIVIVMIKMMKTIMTIIGVIGLKITTPIQYVSAMC